MRYNRYQRGGEGRKTGWLILVDNLVEFAEEQCFRVAPGSVMNPEDGLCNECSIGDFF